MINKSNLPKFDPNIYTKITLNDLVVFSIHYLHNKNVEVKSDDIISACFILFPKRFSLRNHPRWPDSAMVSRHWGVCRSKGYITAGTEPGFKLTTKGVRLAEKVAKVLGITIPKHAAKVQPVVREEKTILPSPTRKIRQPRSKVRAVRQAKKAQSVQKEETTLPVPAKKASPVRVKKASSVKKARTGEIVQKEKTVLPPAARKTRLPRSKVHPAKQVKTTQPVPTRKITPRPARKVQSVPPARTRPTTSIKNVGPIWAEKIKPPKPVVRSVIVKKAQPTQLEKAIHPAVTQEIKVRAGKYVRAIETSDAYIHYKKNGKSSKISEFDFRSLLLCTMESSPETLARNVEQFKGYASIHNRKDLVAFLNFCADKLSYLLAPQINRSTKSARRTMK